MAPIRIGLIGLSANARAAWANEAHLPYLTSGRGKSHYQIVALQNSSIAAAKASRAHFNFGPDVKVYGDPESLAQDPNVDLVVVNTRTDVHFSGAEPALRAGKNVFVEWPLAQDLAHANQLVDLTKGKDPRNNIISLQGRVAPVVLKLKEILQSGRIGKVLSSDIIGYGGNAGRGLVTERFLYFTERAVGGNVVTIGYGHAADMYHEVVGDFEDGEWSSRMQIQRPQVTVIGDGKPVRTANTETPDLIVAHGKLATHERRKVDVADDATFSLSLRIGPQFKGTNGVTWTIYGEKGEILVTSPQGPWLHADTLPAPIEIKVHDFETDEVEDIPWDWQDWQKELPRRCRNVAEVYERYAAWVEAGRPAKVEEGKEWPTLDDALVRMKEIDLLYKRFDAQK